MKILLLQPSIPSISKGVSGTISLEPLALELIAGPLLTKHTVKIVDLKIENTLHRELETMKPDLVGFTAYTMEVPHVLSLCHEINKYKSAPITVIGGLHATMFPETFVKSDFDYLIRGRGEWRFKNLVDALDRGTKPELSSSVIDLKQEFPANLDEDDLWTNETLSNRPARHLVEQYRPLYHLGLMDNCYSLKTSDGCPYQCSFCAVWKYYQGRYYARPAQEVVEEIESIPGQNIVIVDDNFLFNPKRGYQIASILKNKGILKKYFIQSRPDTIVRNQQLVAAWRDVGLTIVALGLDGFREQELTKWNKKTDPEIGIQAISVLNNFGVQSLSEIIIDPDYDKRDFRQLGRYIRKSKTTLVQLSILTPLPGTNLYEEKKGQLTTTDLSKFNVDYPVLPTKLPLWKFFDAIANLYWISYIYPPAIYKRVTLGRHNLWQSMRGFILISAIIYHYKRQSWKFFFQSLFDYIQSFTTSRNRRSGEL